MRRQGVILPLSLLAGILTFIVAFALTIDDGRIHAICIEGPCTIKKPGALGRAVLISASAAVAVAIALFLSLRAIVARAPVERDVQEP